MNQWFIFLFFLNLIIVESSLFILAVQLLLRKMSAVWKARIFKIQLFYLTLPLTIFLIFQISQWTYTEAKPVDMPDFYMIVSITNFYLGFQRYFPIERIMIFFAIWMIGMILLVIRYFIKSRRMNHALLLFSKKSQSAEEMMMKICDELGIKRVPRIRVSGLLPVSCLMGIVHPIIYLTHFSASEQENTVIIKHELYHYKNRDLWVKFFAQIYCFLCWFNPVVYKIKGLLEESLEMAVDEQITENLDKEGVYFYCELLIQRAEYAANFKVTTLGVSFVKNKMNIMKRRLNHMLSFKKSKMKNLAAGILAAAMVLVTPVNVYASSEVIKSYFEENMLVAETTESTQIPVQEFVEGTLDLSEYNNEGTFSLTRGNNQILETINAQSSKQCLNLYLYKGDVVTTSLSGSSKDASFSLWVGTKQISSLNGFLNGTYTIPSNGTYTFIIVNTSNVQIKVSGYIDIESKK